MLSAILLISENKKLQIENQRQKRKRAQKRTYIARGGVLLGAEGASRVSTAQEGAAEGAAEAAAGPRQRVKPRCSMCKLTEHNARTCPKRQATSQQIAIYNIIVRCYIIRVIWPQKWGGWPAQGYSQLGGGLRYRLLDLLKLLLIDIAAPSIYKVALFT